MIDFKSSSFLKLSSAPTKDFSNLLEPMLVSGEEIVQCFRRARDGVVFTTKRIFAINVQGRTGTKKDFTSLPYSKIQAFSVETAGLLDSDCELELWFSGLGIVKFEFNALTDIAQICKIISERVL